MNKRKYDTNINNELKNKTTNSEDDNKEKDFILNIKNPLQQLNSEDIERCEVIGYGSFAVVFKGYYRCCPVAIKCLSGKVSGEDFAKEVLLMR